MPIRIYGTNGNDSIYHPEYNTTYTYIYAQDGRDYIWGSEFGSHVEGGSGSDNIYTFDAADTIFGQADNDYIILRGGDDYVDGGSGVDTIYLNSARAGVRVDLAAETLEAFSSAYADRIGQKTIKNVENVVGTGWADAIVGNSAGNLANGLNGNDTFDLGAGDDTAIGGEGNDTFYEGAGDDHYDGGEGYDRLDLIEHTGSVRLYTAKQTLSDRHADGPSIGDNTFESIESFRLGEGNDYIDARGDTVDNIYAWRGDDTVVIGKGDFADGVSGHDTLYLKALGANAYHDLELGKSTYGSETLATYNRFETFRGGDHAETFTGSIDGKSVYGFGGSDFFNFHDSTDLYVRGGDGLDLFALDNVSGHFFGEAGDDVYSLNALSAGPLSLNGGGGSDFFSIAMGIPNGTEGFRIDNSEGTVTALFNDSAPVIAISGIENFGGSNLDDRFIGSGIGELVSGGGGDDILSAGGGADTLLGGSGDDTLIGGQGADTIFGGSGNDLLTGGTETDTFFIQHVRAGGTITSFGSDMIVDFDARSPGSGGDILHFGVNGDGLEMRRLDGRVIDSFGDLDTNGDGRVGLGDMGVTAHQGGITLGFDSGFLSFDGVDQLFAGSFDFGTFDLYA